MTEVVKGYLVLVIEEASGKTRDDRFTWDTHGRFDGFVKVEVRGGPRSVKAQTKKAPLIGTSITWREELVVEVLEGAKELRLMLCREKFQGNKRGTSVIAACGIFVTDILDAVPIDKYFELFKPNAGGEGGQMRIGMKYVTDPRQIKTAAARALPSTAEGAAASKGGNPLVPLLLLAAVGGAAAFVATKVKPGSISLPFNLPFTSSSSSTSSRSTSDKGGKGGVVYVVKPKPWWQPVVDAVTGKK